MRTAGSERGAAKRRYSSPRREEQAAQTRERVLAAAAGLFGERGWAGTGMREVASAAGVSVETVYANFGSKQALLKATLDIAVVGDDRPVPLAERQEFKALGRGSPPERARAAAHLVLRVNASTARLGRALRVAAASEPDLDREVVALEQRRRTNVEEGAGLVAGRPVTDIERDALWAVLSMEVYQLLVDTAGWSEDEYVNWIADMIGHHLWPRDEETT